MKTHGMKMGESLSDKLVEAFPADSCHQLEIYLEWIERSLEFIDEETLWERPNEEVNSNGNLLLHLAGNVRQWILHGLGGEPDSRYRDGEFAARGGMDKASLFALVSETVLAAIEVIKQPRTEAEWLERKQIQEYETTLFVAVLHIVEHFSYHTGQIALLAKSVSGKQLGFYDL